MTVLLRSDRIPRLTVIFISVFFLLTGIGYPKLVPTNTKIDILRFDTIIELNAPLVGTHVMLYARYWVGPGHYSVAVVWAEPHAGILNFPTYPPTLNINSNEQNFTINNQFRTKNNSTFCKPIGKRDIFRHKFNGYSLSDIRFAESEALASRIYTSDLEKYANQTNDKWQTINLSNSNDGQKIDREVAEVSLLATEGRLDALKLMDANGQLIKSIDYEYSIQNGRDILNRQNIFLPEKAMVMGFGGKGVTLRINDKEQTYKEFTGLHHRDGRKCTVEYEQVKLGEEFVSLPGRIMVRHAETKTVLRTALLSNYVRLTMSSEEAENAAKKFCQFDDKEIKVRELFSKYWQKEPDKIENADSETLKQLHKHFEDVSINEKTIGEQLKRINMLMELDLIQHDDALQKHFRQYLAILTANNLNDMALVGGIQVIDSTVCWSQFPLADKLLAEWVETAITNCNADLILEFVQNKIIRCNYWTIASLISECSKSHYNWKQKQFDALALRCVSLYDLFEIIKDPSKVKNSRYVAQAGWASWSDGTDGLISDMNESLFDAKRLFADLKEPTLKQKILRSQLEKIDEKIKQSKK